MAEMSEVDDFLGEMKRFLRGLMAEIEEPDLERWLTRDSIVSELRKAVLEIQWMPVFWRHVFGGAIEHVIGCEACQAFLLTMAREALQEG